jgi:hypothetical protein
MTYAPSPAVSPLDALAAFVSQRSGIRFRDYWTGDHWNAHTDARQAFLADYRPILRHGKHARAMLAYLRWRTLPDDLLASVADNGRLTWDATRGEWDYCAGQYFPTEYRRAACRVLASAIEKLWDTDAGGCVSRDDIVRFAHGVFGPAIARAWFR